MRRKKISVAGVQLSQRAGDREHNIAAAIKAIESAKPHDIYVLPELSSSGYSVSVFQALNSLAEDEKGPSFNAFSELAKRKKCFICYSFPRRRNNNEYTICTAVVDRNGRLTAIYDKWHVCSTGECCEQDYFSPGLGPLASFDVDGIKVGIVICYDIRFPELTRTLALDNKISLLVHPGGWPKDECFYTWHTFVQVRAMENQIYIMSTNWAGEKNGGTVFCPPFIDGHMNCSEKLNDSPDVLTGIVDLEHLYEIRDKYPYLKDRSDNLDPTRSTMHQQTLFQTDT